MVKRMILMLAIVGVVFGGIFGYHAFGNYMMMQHFATMQAPPVVVSTIKAAMEPWQPNVKAVGSLRAVQGVDVSSEIPGMITAVHFKSGDEVKEGQVLLELNAEEDMAQLKALTVAAELAKTVYERDKKQLEIQAVSQAVVDADEAEWKSRKAQQDRQAALVSKKKITAPFSGTLGISTLNPGQYVVSGEKLVTLQAVDTMFVDFYVPQQDLSRLAIGQKVDVTTDALPERSFQGTITAINARVEANTRNILVEASIPNAKRELLPGMFVSVDVETGEPGQYLTLPQSAVTYNPYGETVFLVEETGKDEKGAIVLKARQVFVTVGETRGDQLSVLKGIKEGDTVVSSGQHKLKNGSIVIVDNRIQPGNDPAPQPVDQ